MAYQKQTQLNISSVIRQKGESQNDCFKKKQTTPNFPKNEHFLPLDTHTYVCVSGGKKCSFFRKFGLLCFLETPVFRFAILPHYRRYHQGHAWSFNTEPHIIWDIYPIQTVKQKITERYVLLIDLSNFFIIWRKRVSR